MAKELVAILLLLSLVQAAASSRVALATSSYVVDGLALGERFGGAADNTYQCSPSEQFSGFTSCQRARQEKSEGKSTFSTNSILLNPDGTIVYIDRFVRFAFIDQEIAKTVIDRLSGKFGETGRVLNMPNQQGLPHAVIASWGKIELVQVDPKALASGQSLPARLLIDFLGDLQKSAKLGLPVYRLSGGAGYLWSASFDEKRVGQLRFLAIDASALPPASAVTTAPPLDANGWTTFTPSADTRIVYVSNSGSDTNDGLSTSTPVASIAKGISLIRNGSADELLLEKGGVWHESINWPNLSGRSASEPILISSYGTGERPVIASGSQAGFNHINTPLSNLAIVGLDFYADTRDPASPTFTGTAGNIGIRVISDASNILIEDTRVRFYDTNVALGENSLGLHLNNITLHRDIITDAYSTSGISQGLYADLQGTGLVLDGNLFDHNGWNAQIPGAGPTIFSHDVYIQYTSGPATLNENIFANAASHGAQLRDGGTVTNNLFVHDPIGLYYGYPGQVATAGLVSNNVFTEANDITPGLPRGFGIDVYPASGPVGVTGNIFTHETSAQPYGHGISLAAGTSGDIVKNDIFYQWDNPIVNNGSSIIDMSTIQINQTGYLDPSRTVESYNASLGYSADLNAFLAEARLQSKDNWNPQLTADGVNDYIREGFNVESSPSP